MLRELGADVREVRVPADLEGLDGLVMPGRDHLDVMDTLCVRNAFGRQVRSFEADLDIPGVDGGPVRAVFIRAPWLAQHGEGVEILASVDGHPVAARQDEMLVIS